MGLLTALAWFALWLLERSPYGRYLRHEPWDTPWLRDGICRILPAGDVLVPGLVHVAGWTVMTAAMMLPTTLPLLEIFRRLTARRSDRRPLMGWLVTGYLGIWSLFGIAVHLLDFSLHALVRGSPWLTFNAWVFGAGALGLAGLFQFSALKYRCLDRCRTPLGFVIEHWRGDSARRQAVLLGVRHGMFCVGCCWALMLLMFAVGTGSIGWMLVLGALMAAEKNLPWGRRLSAPLGVALLGWAALVVAREAGLWLG